MLTKKESTKLRKELETAQNPLFFYDSDGDGLASFLLLYHIQREGTGIRVANNNLLKDLFPRKISELEPDKVFILDIPIFTQELANLAKRPIFWIDHHPPIMLNKVNYYNPRIKTPEAYIPTSRMCWQVSKNPADLWIATIGCLADWHIPDFIDEFIERYPKLIPKKTDLPTMVFKDPISQLVKLFFFIQKGPTKDVRKSINVLKKIKSPEEILEQTTSEGTYLWKRFSQINKQYETLFKEAKKVVTRSKLILFYYSENQWSFTANLANELMARYQQKTVLIARKKGEEYKCSIRGKNIEPKLQKALENVNGRGGGHPDACGAVINEADWDLFLAQLKEELK